MGKGAWRCLIPKFPSSELKQCHIQACGNTKRASIFSSLYFCSHAHLGSRGEENRLLWELDFDETLPLAGVVPIPWVSLEPWPVLASLQLPRLDLGKYQGKGKIQQGRNKSSAL